MGVVYLAQDTVLDRKVALKFLPEELQEDKIARKRFVREAKSAAAIAHPYICGIHEIGEAEGRAFLALEYVEGPTLPSKLQDGPLQLQQILNTAAEIAEALHRAHSLGIVHRDLKPSNIMLTAEGHAKVMDFGLAKRVALRPGADNQEPSLTEGGCTIWHRAAPRGDLVPGNSGSLNSLSEEASLCCRVLRLPATTFLRTARR